ncbi:cyclophilin-like fold protein [Hominimerdicola sp. 21CYCFAH17_S]
MKANDKLFSDLLYNNETAKALIDRLSLKLEMSELNGNELLTAIRI